MKIFTRKFIISVFSLFLIFSFSGYSQVNEKEMSGNDDVKFVENNKRPVKVDTMAAIKSIGSNLAKLIIWNKYKDDQYGAKTLYHVYHFSQNKDGKLAADIFCLGANCGVDQIRNLNAIVGAYIQTLYGYSDEECARLAKLVTNYNAKNRGRIDKFSRLYTDEVCAILVKEKAGLSTNYTFWPGATQIIIPLSGGKIIEDELKTVPVEEVVFEKKNVKVEVIPEPVDEPEPVVESKPVEVVEPVVESKPVEVEESKPVEVAEPIVESKPVEVAEPVVESKPVEVAEPVVESKPVEVAEPVVESKPIEVVEPVVETKPVEVAEPVVESKPVEEKKPEPVVENKPVEQKQPVEEIKPVEETKPVEVTPEPVEETKPIETPQPVEEKKPGKIKKPIFNRKPAPVVESEKVETPQPVVESEKVETPEPVVESKPVEVDVPIVENEKVETPQPVVESEKIEQPKPIEELKPVEQEKTVEPSTEIVEEQKPQESTQEQTEPQVNQWEQIKTEFSQMSKALTEGVKDFVSRYTVDYEAGGYLANLVPAGIVSRFATEQIVVGAQGNLLLYDKILNQTYGLSLMADIGGVVPMDKRIKSVTSGTILLDGFWQIPIPKISNFYVVPQVGLGVTLNGVKCYPDVVNPADGVYGIFTLDTACDAKWYYKPNIYFNGGVDLRWIFDGKFFVSPGIKIGAGYRFLTGGM